MISPQPYDFESFEKLCNSLNGMILMVNGRLQDFAVGVGSVGRESSRTFTSSWYNGFWLEPLERGALMKVYPYEWKLFKSFPDGYRFHKSYNSKPDSETIFVELS